MSNQDEGPPDPKKRKSGASEKLIRAAEKATQVENLKALIYAANELIRQHQVEIETLEERVATVAITPEQELVRLEQIRAGIHTVRTASDRVKEVMTEIIDLFDQIQGSPNVSQNMRTGFRESIDLLMTTREQFNIRQKQIQEDFTGEN